MTLAKGKGLGTKGLNLAKAEAAAGTPGEGVDNLLLESGDNLLLESGTPDVLLLE